MLKINDLSIVYNENKILDCVNFEFKRGEVNVITGKSGSGKSSIIKAINGVIPSFVKADITGTMILNDIDITNDSIEKRSEHISSVFQNPKTQFFTIRTDDEIAFGLENQNMPRDEIFKTIDKYTTLLGTKDLLNRNIFDLSGGEKQILAITSVVSLDKEVYLFDEPSSSLDMDSISRLKRAITYLKEAGKIVIIVEHRLFYLTDVMDNLHIIENGKAIKAAGNDINDMLIKEHNLRTLKKICIEDLRQNINYNMCNMFNKSDVSSFYMQCLDYKFRYEHEKPVFDMNTGFDRGIHFIIGKNGVGKTTFMRALCGLNKMKKSRTVIDGERVKRNYEYISLVMQDVNYQIFTESVYSEISIVSDDEKLKEDTLRKMGLWKYKDDHPQSLSGGEKQRLLFGLCICSDKPIVILDEPTSGLCKHNMDIMIENIHQMEKAGKTVIIVTHDYEFITNCGGIIHEAISL